MRTRSQAKAAKSSAAAPDPGGGGGRGGVRRKRQAARTDASAEAAAVEDLVGNSGPSVDADAVMVEAGDEVAGVKVEGKFVVAGDAVVVTDAGTDGGLALLSDFLYETESAGMLGTGGSGDGSDENVQVPNGDEREGNLGVVAADLQTQEEPTARTVEQSACSAPQHAGAEPNKSERFATYQLPCLDSGDIRVSDLVWSKLEGYPWWPGEVFDPSDASELALKHQMRGNHLVAYFGDGTFAWSNESQLMPFMTNYAQMEKQISSDEFINAVNHALEELSRRILSGMSCSCSPEELSGLSYLVENHGLKEGVTCSTANRAEVLKYFRPANLLHYVKSLALSPGQGGDLLELVIACSQLTSFYRSKGCPELASYQTASGWADNDLDASSTKNVTVEEDVTSVVHRNYGNPRKGRGRPRKRNPENGVELMYEKAGSNLNNTCTYDDPGFKQMAVDIDVLDDSKNGKIRDLDSKPHNETTENGEIDIFGDDSTNEVTVLERAKWGHMHKNHSAEPKELLPQLHSVAVDPMNRNGFSEMIISYFSYYRNYVVTASTEASIIGKAMPERGRKRKIVHSPEVEMTDHLQDSYWSELSLHNDPIHSLKRASTSTRPLRKRKSSQERSLPSSQLLQPEILSPKKQIQVMERPIIHVDGKMPNEMKPTALVLSFGRSAALPSEANLIKMFSRYGPLKETETEVHKDTSTVKVVFKKRADAESAFSVAGKYGTFGPSLRSYRLVNMPFSLGAPEVSNPSPEVETTDHMQDSYWSGLSLHNHPIHDLRKENSGTRPRRRRRSSRQEYVPLSELGASVPKKQIQVLERSIIHVDEKLVDELKPTALVLSFGRSAAIPSEMDLVKMFSRYGPLKETETEVHKATNTVKVVFKKRADAERAFSAAGKYGTFGPSLRSYRLVNMPFSLSTLEAKNPVKHPEDLGTEIPGSNKSEAPQDAMEVDQVDKTVKAEVGEPSVEQVDTLKQTSQVEAADTAFINQIDMVEKTGKIDAEPIGNVAGTATQAESVAKESPEQVGNVEQAYTQKEASAGCLPDITQSEAVTGVSSGDTVDEIQQGEAPHQSSIDDRTDSLQMDTASEAQTLHSGAIVKESPQDVSDNMQTDIVAEAPKQSHISEENAVFEAVAEVPSTAQETENEPEEHMASPDLQSPNSSEQPVEQDATEEKLGSEAPKQESSEVPCISKLEAETSAAEPVEQGTVEQAEVEVESRTTIQVPGKQVYSIEQTGQVEAVPEASGRQLEVGDQTPQDESMADASTGETVEEKGVPVEENVENNAAAVELVKETAEGETKEEAPDSKIENKAATDPLAGEAREGEITVDAPDGNTENKAVAAPITVETAEDQTTAAPLDEDTRTADGTVEDVKAVDDKTISAEKPVDDATVVTADEETIMVEKTVEDAMVEPPAEKTTTAEKTPEDAVVEPPGVKITEAETPEDAMVEPPGAETTEAVKTLEDAMVEPRGAETTEAVKTREDAIVEPSGTKTTESEKTQFF